MSRCANQLELLRLQKEGLEGEVKRLQADRRKLVKDKRTAEQRQIEIQARADASRDEGARVGACPLPCTVGCEGSAGHRGAHACDRSRPAALMLQLAAALEELRQRFGEREQAQAMQFDDAVSQVRLCHRGGGGVGVGGFGSGVLGRGIWGSHWPNPPASAA